VSEEAHLDGGRVASVTWVAEPTERNSAEDFEILGSLSTMYSRLFEGATRIPEGIAALDIAVAPGMLTSIVPHDFASDELRLWRLTLEPNTEV